MKVKNLVKIYKENNKEVIALNNVNISLPDKGLVFITGKSGSGKSTLLNILGGMDNPTSGSVEMFGIDITKLTGKNLANFRNRQIGFVFQNYNLIEDMTVYENVALSLDLQHIKYSKKTILDILDSLEIKPLFKRKVKDLSGGEKQRVAIARAIIKEPRVLLCDEPTGNLDEINSQGIFNILKTISKEKLVIVVTHNKEASLTFGDKVIEIIDGNYSEVLSTGKGTEPIKIQNAKMKFSTKIRLSLKNVWSKKFRLAVTLLLLALSFTAFGLSHILDKYNEIEILANTINKNNSGQIKISKNASNKGKYIAPKEMSELEKKIKKTVIRYSKLVSNNEVVKLTQDSMFLKEEYLDNAYYTNLIQPYEMLFEVYDEADILNLNILGNYPENSKDIIIKQAFAEILISNVINIVNEKDKIVEFRANSFEELIGLKLPITSEIDATNVRFVTVKGILIDDNLGKYESLKNQSEEDNYIHPTKLYKEFKEYIKNENIYNIIVKSEFVQEGNFTANTIINNTQTPLVTVLYFNDKKDFQNIVVGKPALSFYIFDGESTKMIDRINENEIVLGSSSLYYLYQDDYEKIRKEIYQKAKNEYDRALIEYNLQMEEYLESGIVPSIKEPLKPDSYKLEQQIKEMLFKEKGLANKTITLEIVDEDKIFQEETTKTFELKIIGIAVETKDTDYKIYNSIINDRFKPYLLPTEVPYEIEFEETDKNELISLFAEFENDTKYSIETAYSNDIKLISQVANKAINVLKIISIILLIFTIILFALFSYMSINSSKRKIGVLVSLGIKTKDCIEIYVLESIWLGILSFVLSNALIITLIRIANIYVSQSIGFTIDIFSYSSIIPLNILISISIIILMSSILPIIRISKMKPVNILKA